MATDIPPVREGPAAKEPAAGQADAGQAAKGTKGAKPGRRALIIGVAIAVLYAIPYAYTANPRACASCHEMQPYYKSWRASTHSRAASNCLYCHVRPGAVNLALYRVLFYRELAAEMLGLDLKPLGTTIPGVESCHRSGCHSLNRLTSTSGAIKINHRKHVVGAHLACIKCHPGAAHKGVGGRRLLPPRKLCKQCHAAQMKDCLYCHSSQVRPLSPEAH